MFCVVNAAKILTISTAKKSSKYRLMTCICRSKWSLSSKKNTPKHGHDQCKLSKRYNTTSNKQIFSLENKVAIITGAANGIGRETAKLFHSQNATIIGIDIDEKGLQSLKTECNNDRIDTFKADVTDSSQVKQYIDTTFNKYGKINILCNIAGGIANVENLSQFHLRSLDDIRNTIDMNLWGSIYNVYYVINYMLSTLSDCKDGEEEDCSIINLTSLAGTQAFGLGSDYTISKHGADGLTKAICSDYGASGIRCNSVKPGFITTKLTVGMDDLMESRTGERPFTDLSKIVTPREKWGSVKEVASLCLYLASDQSKNVNGSMILVDGGTVSTYSHSPSLINKS